jgi:hypothetical protein
LDFESAVVADYDAQSAVERELVLRLASLLWRLRRAATMETGLFEIQAKRLLEFQKSRQANQDDPHRLIHAMFGPADPISSDLDARHEETRFRTSRRQELGADGPHHD